MNRDVLALRTPAALVDLPVLERNCRSMAARATRTGVRLRPHVKTHKCVEAARLQVEGHFGGITVSTRAEAWFFAAGGFRDITLAVPLAPARAGDVVRLARTVDHFQVVVDSAEAVRALEEAAGGPTVPVLLKVDCGYHRAGVDPDDPAGLLLAEGIARSKRLEFRGILTHAGHAYNARNGADLRRIGAQEREVTVAYAERLRAAGIDVPEVSIGSTPTMAVAEALPGVTEVRPGNYVFFDDFQAAIGSCRRDDRAFSVLVTVIGCHPRRRRLVVDGGALALSKDAGARHIGVEGYGSVSDAVTGTPLDLVVDGLSQEHGIVRPTRNADLDVARFPVGTMLRVHPNHSCLAAACFDAYHVVEEGSLVDVWRPCRGW